jgi:glycosyltransferase involved in cell wall biosynthesis
MKLAVFALFQDAEHDEESRHWLQQLVRALAQSSTTEQLILYTDQEQSPGLSAQNLRIEQVEPARFFWRGWQQQRLWRKQLQEQNVQSVLFFGLQSVFAVSCPSYLVLVPADMGRGRQLRQRLKGPDFKQTFVASEAAFHEVARKLGGPAHSITVLHGTPQERQLEVPDTQLVKDRFTDGAEYFFCSGSLQDTDAVILLLKAFSRFKRRQKSGWKLVLAPEKNSGKLAELLATYKYRHDVVLVPRPDNEIAQALYAGAYCFVQPAAPAYFNMALLHSLSWGLPIIAAAACREWAGAAALYFDDADEESLAAQLMTLYKDEGLRQRLAAAAAQRAAEFSWQPLLQIIGNS